MVLQFSKYRFWVGLAFVGIVFSCLFYLTIQSGSLVLHPVNNAKILNSDKSISLPYFSTRTTHDSLVDYGYSIQLTGKVAELLKSDVEKSSSLVVNGLLFLQVVNGGDVYLNDVWVAGLPKSTATQRWLWYRPMLIPLPPNLINSDGQPDVIKIVQSTHEPYISISRPYIGNMFDLRMVYEVAIFLSSTLANASNLLCLIVGLFIIGAWLISPKDNIFGLAGAASVLWSLLFVLALWTYMPISFYKIWRWTMYLVTGGFIVLMSMFVLTFIGEPLRKFGIIILLGYASIAPICYGIWGGAVESLLNTFWTVPMMLAYVYACARLTFYCIRVKSMLSIALLTQSIVCVALALHDYGVFTGFLASLSSADTEWSWSSLFFESIYLTHLGFPFLILIVGYIFLDQYRGHVNSIQNYTCYLKKRLHERELELDLSYESQKKMERLDAARLERERIYQDIHDGIGSRLVTAVFSIRRGNIQASAIEVQLLDCLSDLRFVVNSENDKNDDIQSAIFEYCDNQEYLLAGDNLLLSCYISESPGIFLPLQTHLSIIRILQEALTNIIKHANASEICVNFEVKNAEIILSISDNGQGVHASSAGRRLSDFGLSGGKGLIGMTARAYKIGGRFSLDRVGLWTVACLCVPYTPQPLMDSTASSSLDYSVQT